MYRYFRASARARYKSAISKLLMVQRDSFCNGYANGF